MAAMGEGGGGGLSGGSIITGVDLSLKSGRRTILEGLKDLPQKVKYLKLSNKYSCVSTFSMCTFCSYQAP